MLDRTGSETNSSPPRIKRRRLLRGVGALGGVASLAGCLGTVNREYESETVSVPEDTAEEYGYRTDPSVTRNEVELQRDVGVASLEAKLTSHTLEYEYQGGAASGGDGEPKATPTPTDTRTSQQTPTDTQTPTTDPDDQPTQDEPASIEIAVRGGGTTNTLRVSRNGLRTHVSEAATDDAGNRNGPTLLCGVDMHENKTIVWGASTVSFDGGATESADGGVGLSVGTGAGDAGSYTATVVLAHRELEGLIYTGLVPVNTEDGDAGTNDYTASVASIDTGSGDAESHTAIVEVTTDGTERQTATIPIAPRSGDPSDYTATVADVAPTRGPTGAGDSTPKDGATGGDGLVCALQPMDEFEPAGIQSRNHGFFTSKSRNHGFFTYSGLQDGRGVIDVTTNDLTNVDDGFTLFWIDASGLGPEQYVTLSGGQDEGTVRVGGRGGPALLSVNIDTAANGVAVSSVDVQGNETQLDAYTSEDPSIEFEVTGAPGNDRVVTNSNPDPEVVGQELSSFGDKRIEEIMVSRTSAFEQACGCSLGNPDRINVRSISNPHNIRLKWNGSGWAPPPASEGEGLPETVTLLDEERPVGYFAFTNEREDGDGLLTNLLMVAKGTNDEGDTVIANYVAERQHPPVSGSFQLIGENGVFTPTEVESIADRFAPVCPSMTTTVEPS